MVAGIHVFASIVLSLSVTVPCLRTHSHDLVEALADGFPRSAHEISWVDIYEGIQAFRYLEEHAATEKIGNAR